jgi:O-acetylserine/cysteine efflux transporter
MPFKHVALIIAVMAIWGFNFVVIRVGLGSMPPLLLGALRFSVAALPVVFVKRPDVPLPKMLLIGSTLFLGQFAFLFPAMKVGMPAGLASVTLQSQAFMTIAIAAALLGERPRPRQLVGAAITAAGLGLIMLTIGGEFTWLGLALTLAAALSWASGNVAMRTAGQVDMLAMVIWLSLIPPLPLFALSYGIEGWPAISAALTGMSWLGAGSILYLAVLATLFGYGIWSWLLKHHPASTVAPFSLLVPLFGTLSAHLVLGETFEPLRVAGMALILMGLAAIALPWPARRPLQAK